MDSKNNIEELTLIKDLKKGDIKAFDKLYHLYKKRTFFFVKRMVKLTEEAEGIVQEVFMKLWEGRSELKDDTTINAWLFRIAYNLSIDKLRKLTCSKEYLDYLKYYSKDENLDTEKVVNFNLLQEKLDEIVATLPEQRKIIFQLSRKEGLSNKEIAEKLNISINTVENQLVSSLKLIRKSLSNFRSILLTLF